MRSFTAAAMILAGMATAPAFAQVTGPTDRLINVNFTGTVTNDVTDTIMIRQPNGQLAKYTGPVPDYPYKKGDQVTISFSTRVPTKQYYDVYTGQQAADGIYRIGVSGQNNPSATFGNTRDFDVSGPIGGSPSGSVPSFGGMVIVFDANADTYSLEFPATNWNYSYVTGPSFGYDQTTGTVTSTPVRCSDCADGFSVGFSGASGGSPSNNIDMGRTAIYGPDSSVVNGGPGYWGYFNGPSLSGGWNLPTLSGSSGGTNVPEPGMMVLFGAGALALVRRKRKKAA